MRFMLALVSLFGRFLFWSAAVLCSAAFVFPLFFELWTAVA